MQLQETPRKAAIGHFDVAVIGAGFSGAMLAVHLMEESEPPSVALIEKTRVFGPGLAYGAVAPEHLLNVPAGKMSAFPDRPEHFLEWVRAHPELAEAYEVKAVEPTAFLPRGLYGRYLASLVEEAGQRTQRLELVNMEAVDVEPDVDGKFLVSFADGKQLHADQVVLAWGNLPPAVPGGANREEAAALLLNPWSPEARAALAEPGEVLIIGSGLSCLDLLATARKAGRGGRIHVLSRHGLFPQHHSRPAGTPPRPGIFQAGELPRTMRTLFRAVRLELRKAEREGADWRSVVDALRPWTQELWRMLSLKERRRFLRHVRTLWETVRHRAAPEMRSAKEDLENIGRLTCHRGRILQIRKHADGAEVVFCPRGSRVEQTLHVRAVINATGPETDPRKIHSRLLQNLLRRKLIRADPLGLGIETRDGKCDGLDPLHAVGSLRKGALWESTAVPELRVQSQELARRLMDARAGGGTLSHFWLFEI